ncbi:Scr1 family TA system antitoxin-like transcriptional regulator [Bailinhaonella thermotolerans]|uniref:Scr1 family TA system antitoxin-like transcriptional regulator n=1 Tax=Bailinhaonella thermotolerans TaxID=1070861 RepID=UPI003BEF47AE
MRSRGMTGTHSPLSCGAYAEEIDRIVVVRMRRQGRLAGDGSLKTWFVLNEDTVRRAVGGREVMRNQIGHPDAISLRVPFSAARGSGRVLLNEVPDAVEPRACAA